MIHDIIQNLLSLVVRKEDDENRLHPGGRRLRRHLQVGLQTQAWGEDKFYSNKYEIRARNHNIFSTFKFFFFAGPLDLYFQ